MQRSANIERHYGEGDGNGENIMNPQTIVHLKEGAHMEMETTQIKESIHGSCDERRSGRKRILRDP